MGWMWESLHPDEKVPGLRVEVVPSELLSAILNSPTFNLGDRAPGAIPTDQALDICSLIRSGHADPSRLRNWSDDSSLSPELRAGIRFELASYLGRQGLDDPAFIEQAISEWRRVLQLYPRAASSRRWAIATLEMAQCYAARHEANRTANLKEALRLLDAALEILSIERFAEDFALAQSRKANLLLDIGSDPSLIERSLLAFDAALKVYSRESYPDDWALVLSNMATAYLTRGGYSGFDDLRLAISCMEKSLSVRKREVAPYEWALTRMNMGLALSRMPASDSDLPLSRAITALRGAYEVLSELEQEPERLSCAYNLGLTLARSKDPSVAEEACNCLEECLNWLRETKQHEQAEDCIAMLSQVYCGWLQSETNSPKAEMICRRALAAFRDLEEDQYGMQVNQHVALWLLRHAETRQDRLELAQVAFERLLVASRAARYADLRAGSLANLATILLLKQGINQDVNRARARDCMNEALKILRSLPSTPEREEQTGLIIMNQVRSGLGTGLSS
jgi:tetratricopeptide (TPR) repeat protein